MGTEGRLARLQLFVTGNGVSRDAPPVQLPLDGTIFPPPKREGEFFFQGGIIREVDGKDSRVAKAVNGLYLQASAIEHFADVTPSTTYRDLQRYYKINQKAKLFVAELGGEIVGAVTVAPEEGLRSAKINRIVRKEDKLGMGIGEALGRHARDFCFDFPPEGFGVSSITIGVILGVEGSPASLKLFQKLGFKLSETIDKRCDGYSREQDKLVPRKVAVMILTREKYDKDREIEELTREEEAKQVLLSATQEKPSTVQQ